MVVFTQGKNVWCVHWIKKSNFNNFQQWVDYFLFLMDGFVVSSFLLKKIKNKKRKKKENRPKSISGFTKYFYNSFSLTSENSSLIVTTDNCDIFCWMMHKIIHNNKGRLQFTSQWLEPPQGATTHSEPCQPWPESTECKHTPTSNRASFINIRRHLGIYKHQHTFQIATPFI